MVNVLRGTFLIFTLACLAACTGDLSGQLGSSSEPLLQPITVDTPYTGFTNWNEYVQNDGPTPYDATGVACSGAEAPYYRSCVHVGEMRKIAISERDSCQGLTAVDLLGAFDWQCRDLGSSVEFVSRYLKQGKRLADLINSTSWRQNQLIVSDGGFEIGRTSLVAWWGNSITEAPDATGGTQVLNVANEIYIANSSQEIESFNIDADGIALVTADGVEFTRNNSGDTCDYTTGSTGGVNRRVMICTGAQKFLWIEANLDTVPARSRHGIVLSNGTVFSVVRGTYIKNVFDVGVYLFSSHRNRVEDMTITDIGSNEGIASDENSILVNNSDENLIHRVRMAYTQDSHIQIAGGSVRTQVFDVSGHTNWGASDGFEFSNGEEHEIVGLKVFNGTNIGFDTWGGSGDVTLVNFLASHTQLGLHNEDVRNTYTHMTSVASVNRGMENHSGGNNATINNFVAVGNEREGLWIQNDSGIIVNNFAATENGFSSTGNAISVTSAPGLELHGSLMVGNNRNDECFSTGDGVVNIGCTLSGTDGSSDYGALLSTAILRTNRTISTSFVGQIGSQDSANLDVAALGSLLFTSITDFINFENPFRGWGTGGASFPSVTVIDDCRSGETCHIYDWSLKSSDTVIRDNIGDGANQNPPFVAGFTCPSPIHGDSVLEDKQQRNHHAYINALENNGAAGGNNDSICESGELCYNRFLENAIEIVMDDVGDDDGLCESGEACIYAPNFGAYQGHGNLVGPCSFVDGGASGVQGVTMYAFGQNGR